MARIAIIAPVFPPYRSSGAVQLWDLSKEFIRQGHDITVFVPSSEISLPFVTEMIEDVHIVRLRAPHSRDTFYLRRAISEFFAPYFMLRNLRLSSIDPTNFNGIVCYSPSIFLTPFSKYLKNRSQCRAYLIVRDIFPEWALNLNLMRKGLAYYFLKWIEYLQYKFANKIGVQTAGNLSYFEINYSDLYGSVEVLHNWLAQPSSTKCSVLLKDTLLVGKKIVVYAGNMGVAQNLEIFIHLAAKIRNRLDIGFLFVGRGSDKKRLQKLSEQLNLSNVLFFDEIPPEEIAGLYSQCHIGLVALDERHKTHNIPGKFLSYMTAGLPVLALVNPGNDLLALISEERVGVVTSEFKLDSISHELEALLNNLPEVDFESNCKGLAKRLYSPDSAVSQIVKGLGL